MATDTRRSTYTQFRLLYLLFRSTKTSSSAEDLSSMLLAEGGRAAYISPKAIVTLLDSMKSWGLTTALPGSYTDSTLRLYTLTIQGEQLANLFFDERSPSRVDPFRSSWKTDKSRFKKDLVVCVLEHQGPCTIEEIMELTGMSRATVMSALYNTQDAAKGREYPSKYLVDSGAVDRPGRDLYSLRNKRAYLPEVKPELKLDISATDEEKAALLALWSLCVTPEGECQQGVSSSLLAIQRTGYLDAWAPTSIQLLRDLCQKKLAQEDGEANFKLTHLGQLLFNCPEGVHVEIPDALRASFLVSRTPALTLADIGLLLDDSDEPPMSTSSPFTLWDEEEEVDIDQILSSTPQSEDVPPKLDDTLTQMLIWMSLANSPGAYFSPRAIANGYRDRGGKDPDMAEFGVINFFLDHGLIEAVVQEHSDADPGTPEGYRLTAWGKKFCALASKGKATSFTNPDAVDPLQGLANVAVPGQENDFWRSLRTSAHLDVDKFDANVSEPLRKLLIYLGHLPPVMRDRFVPRDLDKVFQQHGGTSQGFDPLNYLLALGYLAEANEPGKYKLTDMGLKVSHHLWMEDGAGTVRHCQDSPTPVEDTPQLPEAPSDKFDNLYNEIYMKPSDQEQPAETLGSVTYSIRVEQDLYLRLTSLGLLMGIQEDDAASTVASKILKERLARVAQLLCEMEG